MSNTIESSKTNKKLISSLEKLLSKQKLKKNDNQNISVLQRELYRFLRLEEIASYSVDDLFKNVLSLYSFIEKRQKGEIKIRVFNPTSKDHGWDSPYTVVELVNADKPFLVDSVTEEILRHEYAVMQLMHPVLHFNRDNKGVLESIAPTDNAESYPLESLMQFHIEHIESAEERERLQKDIVKVLEQVGVAVADWREVMQHVEGMVEEFERGKETLKGSYSKAELASLRTEIEEVLSFLCWLKNDNFVFLGYRKYESQKGNLSFVRGSSLGIFKKAAHELEPKELDINKVTKLQVGKSSAGILTITKANKKSVIHRPVHMDYIVLRSFDSKGNVTGEHRIVGMFTSTVYYQSARHIPIVKNKIAAIQEQSGFSSHGHSGKALMAVLEDFPRDELFQASEKTLFDAAMGIATCSLQPKVRFFVRQDEYQRFMSCIIMIPKEKMSTSLRHKMETILCDFFKGTVSNHYTQISESHLARVQVIIKTTPGKIPAFDPLEIEAALTDAALSWEDRLEKELLKRFNEHQGVAFFKEYGGAFSLSYQNRFSALDAYFDILKIEKVKEIHNTAFDLYDSGNDEPGVFSFKVYHPKDKIDLSSMMPLLENMGLVVLDEHTYFVDPATAEEPVWVHRFRISMRGNRKLALKDIKQNFEEALSKTWKGEIQNDSLNKLILLSGLPWRNVVLLRAYSKYLQQAGFRYSQGYIAEALAHHPEIVKNLVRLFYIRFNPEEYDQANAAKQQSAVIKSIESALVKVSNLAEDRVIRAYLELLKATLRTNFFQKDAEGNVKTYISCKFDSSKISFLPKPRPYAEIFVYSSRMEGIHLRGGKVARGGLRWSDRGEDFRTEVLGLMKAQMTKNSVIIPVGSKGGFVVKKPPVEGGREAFLQEGIECYKTFLRGLLDITDNRVGNKIVSPKQVVSHDEYDPYLVVAADKGTATFSDIANGVSEEYGFWLGDAFASGGSAGYDHKKMGITAKGAWVSVKRHFSEMGVNVDKDDFTVIGVGDMSGDVFGNGMLLSKHIRLVAAFNHLHIFLDPNPKADESFKERVRLFNLPRSTWKDYNPKLLSKGGTVFDRSAKSVTLNKEIQSLLGINEKTLTPDELIQHILRAKVDLFWNGGIGTYVKARTESHDDVGDKMNDSVRINGEEIGAKVVGEGGNLGFTQLGRIEYADRGGRINTDAIDNSAGVDCSDHEVNIKIALGKAIEEKKLPLEKRNKLLEVMTDEVAELVLRDNTLQTQALTIAHMHGSQQLESHARLIEKLEDEGALDRAVEFLPDEEEIQRRALGGKGLTRPELSVVLAYSKLTLYSELVQTNLPDEKYYERDLLSYFPEKLQKTYQSEILNHPLRREIVATSVTNSIVNRIGSTVYYHLQEDNGAKGCDIARGYTVARDVFQLRDLWNGIDESISSTPLDIRISLYDEVQKLIEHVTLWLLRHYPQPIDIQRAVEEFSDGVQVLSQNWKTILPADLYKEIYEDKYNEYVGHSVPQPIAEKIAGLAPLAAAFDIITVANRAKLNVKVVAKVYFSLGERLCISWLRHVISGISAGSYWQRMSLKTLNAELFDQQAYLTAEVIKVLCEDNVCTDAVESWFDINAKKIERFLDIMKDLRTQEEMNESMVVIALRKLQELHV